MLGMAKFPPILNRTPDEPGGAQGFGANKTFKTPLAASRTLVGLGGVVQVLPVGERLTEARERSRLQEWDEEGQVPGIGANTARKVRLFNRTIAIGKGGPW